MAFTQRKNGSKYHHRGRRQQQRVKPMRKCSHLELEPLESRLLLDGATSQLFVSRLYEQILLRPADSTGLEGWTGLLDQGRPRSEVAVGFLNSPEYQTPQV